MRIFEIFNSIQGEGLTIGAPTVFIRAVGCNLRCDWCDTNYSFEGGTEMTVDEIMERVGSAFRVCLTGSEPMLQPDTPELIRKLASKGIQVVLETNGSVDLSGIPDYPLVQISMDWKCPSSGMTNRMLQSNLDVLSGKDQLKFIIKDDVDLDYAVNFIKTHNIRSSVIFGPVGGTERLDWLVQRVLSEHLDIRVLPQLHKIIWGDKTGV